jgi:uncharacterized protein YjbI with pentapeptide repeats
MSQTGSLKRTYEESCQFLQKNGWLDAGVPFPDLPCKRPLFDDELLGVSFFRTRVMDAKFENLTLPRTFFGRSEIQNVSFAGSDLSESTLCWNDFVEVDFTGCNLSGCDLRAAFFDGVKFTGADLSGTDLRLSQYTNCEFSNACLMGAKLTKKQRQALQLSAQQEQQVDWQDSDGEEPGGG